MVELTHNGVYLINGEKIVTDATEASAMVEQTITAEACKKNTMAYNILTSHNVSGNDHDLKIKFDAMASHDITYVGIIQTARASGMKKFPLPYVLTNCHNSLCAVGGTINEDDHVFGLSAAKKYGGIFVPAHQAVIHQYMREVMSGCGKMLLGSDSHTRYGALGTMAMGEGGPELVKQLLEKTYDIAYPEVIAVYLDGTPAEGVGPQDIALAIIGKVFKNGFVKNKVMEFVGPGIAQLPIEYRNGIDVMTTETSCLSSIWQTDEEVNAYFAKHQRPEAYKELKPGDVAYYDGLVYVDMSKVEPMIALPFHPSNTYTIRELIENPLEILSKVEEDAIKQFNNPDLKGELTSKVIDGKIHVDQGIIAGCSGGTYDNIYMAAEMIGDGDIGDDVFTMSVYPASQPVFMELNKKGSINKLMAAGITVKSAFCGPCFGAGDTPANNALSIRHTTRNFPNREGSKPGDCQISWVALMDARSITATALNGGVLTPATNVDTTVAEYEFDSSVYDKRVYKGWGEAKESYELHYGPNIKDWPTMTDLPNHLVLKMVSYIDDPVTTTDELIPSGETSSYRSNPLRLSEFALSRKDPQYVPRAKAMHRVEIARQAVVKGERELTAELDDYYQQFAEEADVTEWLENTGFGSVIYANKPGDGSAREQAASCQKVLGGWANIAIDYATKRYRSNVINWGMLPFIIDEQDKDKFGIGDVLYIKDIRDTILTGKDQVTAKIITDGKEDEITLKLPQLTQDQRDIIAEGCLINYYRSNK